MTAPPSVLTSLRRILAHWADALTIPSTAGSIAAGLAAIRKDITLMATRAELESALSRLQTAVTGKLQGVSDQLASLTTAFAAFRDEDTAEDAAYTAQIADLQAQLAQATTLTDDALAAITATAAGLESPSPMP